MFSWDSPGRREHVDPLGLINSFYRDTRARSDGSLGGVFSVSDILGASVVDSCSGGSCPVVSTINKRLWTLTGWKPY